MKSAPIIDLRVGENTVRTSFHSRTKVNSFISGRPGGSWSSLVIRPWLLVRITTEHDLRVTPVPQLLPR